MKENIEINFYEEENKNAEKISLHKLWDFLLRTKQLPDGWDPRTFYETIRDKLRDAEKEVKLHSLRVLYDLISVTKDDNIDQFMHILMPELLNSLENPGPAIRKASLDSLRNYLHKSKIYHDILKRILISVDIAVVVISAPYILKISSSEKSLKSLVNVIWIAAETKNANQEEALKSLARIRFLVGDRKFKNILGVRMTEFEKLCDTIGLPNTSNDIDFEERDKSNWELSEIPPENYKIFSPENPRKKLENLKNFPENPKKNPENTNNFPENPKSFTENIFFSDEDQTILDRVILETEITLKTGPAITMKIHEESRSNSRNGTSEEDDSRHDMGIVRVLDDNSDDFYESARRTPRKVRFGGEIVKMRTPESDSSNKDDDDDDHSTTINITVTDAISIKTKKSLIPVRITSLPSTPKKTLQVPKRFHRSTPNLAHSRIPLRYTSTNIVIKNNRSRAPSNILLEDRKTLTQIRSSPNVLLEKKRTVTQSRSPSPNLLLQEKRTVSEARSPSPSGLLQENRSVSQSRSPSPNILLGEKRTTTRSRSPSPNVFLPERRIATPLPEIKDIKEEDKTVKRQKTQEPISKYIKSETENRKDYIHTEETHTKEIKTQKIREQSISDKTKEPMSIEKQIQKQKEDSKVKDKNQPTAEKHKEGAKLIDENQLHIPKPRCSQSRRNSRQEESFSPIPVHNEIELFHNLTRSPERSRKSSTTNMEPIQFEKQQQNIVQKQERFKENLENKLKILSSNINEEKARKKNENARKTSGGWKSKEDIKKTSPWIPKETITKEYTLKEVVTKEITCRDMGSDFDSFQVCSKEKVGESDDKFGNSFECHHLQQSLHSHDLRGEEEVYAKTEALDNLIFALKQPNTCQNLETGPASLLFEALFACQHRERLHGKADEAIEIMVQDLRPEVLNHCMGRLAPSFCKMGSPHGTRMAIIVMKKCNAKQFQIEVIERGYGHRTREGALQILMTAARLLPSQKVEIQRAVQFASIALRDRRRKVRHAALELLASLAQLRCNTQVLDVVERNVTGCPDEKCILQVVRTRLSRKQLPNIEQNGIIRYTSPREQTELDWISGSMTTHSSDSSSSSTPSINYWRHNSRHDDKMVTDLVIQSNVQDDSVNSAGESQIWAVDSSLFSKTGQNINKGVSGILRPVYIVQPDANGNIPSNSIRGYRKYDRGRSFSPPKPHRRIFSDTQEGSTGSAPHHSNFSSQTSKYDGFRKSFSSEQLYFHEKPHHEPYSLSSRSSTTSTGSSTRSGNWQRDFRSGIPIPINPEKLRIRTNVNHHTGPLIATRTIISSLRESPMECRVTPQPIGGHPELVSPRSSGSESSGYFTPPPESQQAFVKLDAEEIQRDTSHDRNQDCVDSYSSDSRHQLFIGDSSIQRSSSVSSQGSSGEMDQKEHVLGEQIESKLEEDLRINSRRNTPIHLDLDLTERSSSRLDLRKKSKSVVDLQTFLPEIHHHNARKSINSAPPLNDDPIPFDETPITPLKTVLPGALESPEHIPELSIPSTSAVTPVSPTEAPGLSKTHRLSKRFSRSTNRKSTRTPRTPMVADDEIQGADKPFSKPREALANSMAQMESCEWEVTVKGIQALVRLIKYHPDLIESNLHPVCAILAKHIKNLRSQVARIACNAAAGLFTNCKKGLDMEFEEVATPLLQRTADTNKFIRADANAALDVMAENLPLNRVITVITHRGSNHQNAVVRAASARILNNIVEKMGPEKVFQMNKETRDRILLALANALTDGSLDCRRHAKTTFSNLVSHHHFQRCLFDAVPAQTLRHIAKTLNSLKPNT